MTKSGQTPERRIRDLVRPPDASHVGRIRLGSSTNRPAVPPTKIERWRLTSPSGGGAAADKRSSCPICGAYEGSKHLGGHSPWRRLVAALARYR